MKITRIEPKELASRPVACACPAEAKDQAAAARWLSDRYSNAFLEEATLPGERFMQDDRVAAERKRTRAHDER